MPHDRPSGYELGCTFLLVVMLAAMCSPLAWALLA